MLLLMRGDVLILSPGDITRRRQVAWYSWLALIFLWWLPWWLWIDCLIVCSLAVGYADDTAPVNRFVPDRIRLEEYVQWHS